MQWSLSEAKDVATVIAAAIAIVSATIALGSAFIAFRTFRMSRANQIEALIQKAYYDYAKMALDNPELAFPPGSTEFDYKTQTLHGKPVDFEKYEWFLSAALVTVHFVVKVDPKNSHWRALTTNQISYHWEYIEAFWNDKRFIQNWRNVLGDQMTEGVKLGKDRYASRKARPAVASP
ncbi:hypothetical protein GPL17_01675 [Bradyrhizobium yuanmingense]|uniref:hypothetical protein n=1 Tax=Bradyrhizobium yuanmingense TaxID=108015 RepID=UPI0012FA762A|nr:hypothetical protein [Bradyrhizobium yuanmingense]MVT49192.1 hypothetical protein [Bradyrhizobium yuanmingense]